MNELQVEAIKDYIDTRIEWYLTLAVGKPPPYTEDQYEALEQHFDSIMLTDIFGVLQ